GLATPRPLYFFPLSCSSPRQSLVAVAAPPLAVACPYPASHSTTRTHRCVPHHSSSLPGQYTLESAPDCRFRQLRQPHRRPPAPERRHSARSNLGRPILVQQP